METGNQGRREFQGENRTWNKQMVGRTGITRNWERENGQWCREQ
jgi:hypothetical protein